MTVNITCVNDAPVADDETVTATEDTPLDTPVTTLLAGDTDADGDTLTVTAVSGATGGTATLMDNGMPADKTDDFVRFTPAANRCAPDGGSYNYTDSHGTLTDIGAVTVNITCVNDAPEGTDSTMTISEDGSHTFAPANFGFTDGNDSPADDFDTVNITSLPAAGSLTFDGTRSRWARRSWSPTSATWCSPRPPTPTATATPRSPSRSATTAAPSTAAWTPTSRRTRSPWTSPP